MIFSMQNAADKTAAPPECHGILWLASFPKSGNTWTRNFLHNLINILERGADAPQDINGMNDLTFWEITVEPYERIIGKPVTDATREEIAAARPKVQELISNAVDGLAMVKTHNCLVLDHGNPMINTDVTAGAVYVVRNPLDVAVSYASHIGGTIDRAIETMNTPNTETVSDKDGVHEIYGSWSQHVDSWTRKPHEAIYVMRYEDMLAYPMQTFRDLAHHLLLNPTKAQLRLAIERSSFEELKKQEEEHGFKERPDQSERFFRSGKAGQWRKVLSPRQVANIVRVHHKQMSRFGYLTDELKHLVPRA